MKYLDNKSLFNTIDNVSEALFFDLDIDKDEQFEVAEFIVNQQGKPYTYANTFAPTAYDLNEDLILFTGEKIKSGAGKCHMIGEEASRVLRQMDLHNEKVELALKKADRGLKEQIDKYYKEQKYEYGMYCCRTCSCALWNNLASGGLDEDTDLLKAGINYLKKHRDNKGRWEGFPFYYTLFVLNSIELGLVSEELKYASGSIEKRLKRKHEKNKYEIRRNLICKMIIKKLNLN